MFFGFVFWFLVKAPAVDGVGSDVALMDKEMADDWSDAIGDASRPMARRDCSSLIGPVDVILWLVIGPSPTAAALQYPNNRQTPNA